MKENGKEKSTLLETWKFKKTNEQFENSKIYSLLVLIRNLYTKIILLPLHSLTDKSDIQFQIYTKGTFEVNNQKWEQYNFVESQPFTVSLIYRNNIIIKESPIPQNLIKSSSEPNLNLSKQDLTEEEKEEIKKWNKLLPEAPFKPFDEEKTIESKKVSFKYLKLVIKIF